MKLVRICVGLLPIALFGFGPQVEAQPAFSMRDIVTNRLPRTAIREHPQIRCLARRLLRPDIYAHMTELRGYPRSPEPWSRPYENEADWWISTVVHYGQSRATADTNGHHLLAVRNDGSIIITFRHGRRFILHTNLPRDARPEWVDEWILANLTHGVARLHERRPFVGVPRACRHSVLQTDLARHRADQNELLCRHRSQGPQRTRFVVAAGACIENGPCLPEGAAVSWRGRRAVNIDTRDHACVSYDGLDGTRHVGWLPSHALRAPPHRAWREDASANEIPYFRPSRTLWRSDSGSIRWQRHDDRRLRGTLQTHGLVEPIVDRLSFLREGNRWMATGEGLRLRLFQHANALVFTGPNDGLWHMVTPAPDRVRQHAADRFPSVLPLSEAPANAFIDPGPLAVTRDRSPRVRCVLRQLLEPPRMALGSTNQFPADWAPLISDDGSITVNRQLGPAPSPLSMVHEAPDHVLHYIHPNGDAAVAWRHGPTLRVRSTPRLPASGHRVLATWRADQGREIENGGRQVDFDSETRTVDLTLCADLQAGVRE